MKIDSASAFRQDHLRWAGRPAAKPFGVRAPGRVNLIGEHTDYNGGLVLPMAINRHVLVIATPRLDRLVRVRSVAFDQEIHFTLDDVSPRTNPDWSDYARGVVAGLLYRGWISRGFDISIGGDLPPGGGLSSSAALCVGLALTLLSLDSRKLPPGTEIARVCQEAEHQYAQVMCGIMDQIVCLFAEADHALLLDCGTMAYKSIPIRFHGVRFLVLDTHVRHQLSQSDYNRRNEECHDAAHQLGIDNLGLLKSEDLPSTLPKLQSPLTLRVRHVVTENDRVRRAVEAFTQGDAAGFGKLLYESHESLRDDFQVSCVEADALVNICRDVPGVIGARITGGGFGGNVLVLAREEAMEELSKVTARLFRPRFGQTPAMRILAPSDGALRLLRHGPVGVPKPAPGGTFTV